MELAHSIAPLRLLVMVLLCSVPNPSCTPALPLLQARTV